MKTPMKWICYITTLAVIFCAGCCCVPPIFFARTGAHGIVLDQYDKPVPRAKLNASWHPIRFFYMSAPSYDVNFEAGSDGKWRFYRRKVEQMHIDLVPQVGYERVPNAYSISLPGTPWFGRDNPTNDFVLRLLRIAPATNAAPSTGKTEGK